MSESVNILEVMQSGIRELERQKVLEETRMQEIKDQAFNFNQSSLTEQQLKIGEEISSTFLKGIEDKITPEQRSQLEALKGTEQLAAAGAIWSSINSVMMAKNFTQGIDAIDIKGIVTKVLLDPIKALAIGNIIYKGIQDFSDGVTTSEVFTFVKDAAPSVISIGKFINGIYQIKTSTDIPGENFLEKMSNYYFDTNTVNVIKAKEFNSYTLNLDTKGVSLQRYVNKTEISDIVALPDLNTTGGLDNSVVGISYKPLDGVDTSFKDANLDLDKEIPQNNFQKIKSSAATLLDFVDIAMETAALVSNVYDVIETVNDGKSVTPSQIMSIISSALGTVGSAVSFAGPVGQIVGAVISGVGSLVESCKAFAELNSESSTKDILFAINDFARGLIPILPSARAIEQATTLEHLKNSATNETDRKLYTALHKIAALDATPIINFTKFIYEPTLKEETRNELLETFGSFDNMMKNYITNDSDFSNNLNKIGEFLKSNENTQHTQFITGYLTPNQIKMIFGDTQYVNAGYEVRNVDTDMMLFKNTEKGNELETVSGLSITPIPTKTTYLGGRDIINRISLGYGIGNSKDGVVSLTYGDREADKNAPRRVDTSTYFGYTKEALEPYKAYGDPVWVILEDDMSGKTQTLPQYYPINNINNRVRAVATDILYADIRTGNGSDDVIVTDILRTSTGANSNVRLVADGGQGEDILDLSHMMKDSIKADSSLKNQNFNWQYSIGDNKLSSVQNGTEGNNHEFTFTDFETIALTDAVNVLDVKEGTDIIADDGKIRDLKFNAINATKNVISFEGVKSAKLTCEVGVDADNNIIGTENDDFLRVQNLEGSEGRGKHILKGLSGKDFIKGGNVKAVLGGINDLQGGEGKDLIVGNGDNNILNGGSGDDMIFGSIMEITDFNNAKEVINGEDGNDYIEVGGMLNTNMATATNNIYTVKGGNGDDTVNISNGNFSQISILDGGEGVDTLDFSKCSNDKGIKVFNLKEESISALNIIGGVSATGFENLIGSNTVDVILGNAGNNILKGNSGDDNIDGEAGNDTIYGDAGDDKIIGGSGTNYLFGGQGNDTFEIHKSEENSFNLVMDFESADKINLDVSDISSVNFNRTRFKDSITGKITDSLVLKTFDNNILVLNDYYNNGHAAEGFSLKLEENIISKDIIAQKVMEARFIDQYGNIMDNVEPGAIVTTEANNSVPMISLVPSTPIVAVEDDLRICLPGVHGA